MISPEKLFLILPGLILSITVHEFAHAYAASLCGDQTAKNQGRVSLNPIDHFDVMGALFIIMSMFAGIGFGWGKPVPVNTGKLRRSIDWVLVTAAGPFSNFFMAFTAAYIFKITGLLTKPPEAMELFFFYFIFQNVALGIFNLCPVPPLDGFNILSGLLPFDMALRLSKVRQYGFIPLIIFIYSPFYRFMTIPMYGITNFLLTVGNFNYKL